MIRLIKWLSNHFGEPGRTRDSAMKRLTMLVTLVMVCSATGSAVAADKATAAKGVEGHWQGLLKVTPQIELRITLEVIKGKDGSLSGNWGSPDEALKGLPLGSIVLKDSVLTFTTKHGVTYRGKVGSRGNRRSSGSGHNGERRTRLPSNASTRPRSSWCRSRRSWKGSGRGS